VETESEAAGTDAGPAAGNVVRFPGDWFGPPEELVPFGPIADAAATAPPSAPLDPGLATDGQLGSGADFWSERAAASHAPVPPARRQGIEAREVPAPPLARSASPATLRSRRRAAAAVTALVAAALGTAMIGVGGSSAPRSASGQVTLGLAVPIQAALASPMRLLAQIRPRAARARTAAPRRQAPARADASAATATARFVSTPSVVTATAAATRLQSVRATGDFARPTANATQQVSATEQMSATGQVSATGHPPAPDAASASATPGGPPPP
jgi:hypothetical protein